jgi:hypothetical protein
MSDVLKGNFKTRQVVTTTDKGAETLEDRFEREALRRLGGSIAFVSKKKIMWGVRDAAVSMTGKTDDKASSDEKPPLDPTPKAANGH